MRRPFEPLKRLKVAEANHEAAAVAAQATGADYGAELIGDDDDSVLRLWCRPK